MPSSRHVSPQKHSPRHGEPFSRDKSSAASTNSRRRRSSSVLWTVGFRGILHFILRHPLTALGFKKLGLSAERLKQATSQKRIRSCLGSAHDDTLFPPAIPWNFTASTFFNCALTTGQYSRAVYAYGLQDGSLARLLQRLSPEACNKGQPSCALPSRPLRSEASIHTHIAIFRVVPCRPWTSLSNQGITPS